ncbi:hypothetical protein DMB92_04195 [Campylobacter sp. MIT 99-7217]|uniref:hypothetical protein n=1 Tax=Campylobacter sp. MIT 99-7217 TaxID=535091 RepID=UPI00115BCC2F|nr:hypothetical protein [Campylobacter sp. MIT 99-7217]TQR33155.1 hypothetical protein DMB92_04195 [Campylobacter sp. MIT 99-7217]
MINKNKLFRQIHIYVSLFFLPLALLYATTGIAYILGANQDTLKSVQSYEIKGVLTKGQEQEFLKDFLIQNKLKLPKGELKPDKREGGFTQGGTHYSVNITQADENTVLIKAQTRSLIGDMIMLHKDKGAWYFSILSVGFGVALLMLYLSGLIITLFAIKKDRNKQIYTLLAGCIITLILAYASL